MECTLRPWRLSDTGFLAQAINNKKIQDNLRDGLPYPYTEQDALDFIEAMLRADPHTIYAFAITVDDQAVGSIGAFRGVNIHARTAEVGYYIAQPYWGQGLATRALRELCRLIFDQTDIVRLFAEPFAHNIASCRVLERCGFVYEGTLRGNAFKNGVLVDMKMYGLLKP